MSAGPYSTSRRPLKRPKIDAETSALGPFKADNSLFCRAVSVFHSSPSRNARLLSRSSFPLRPDHLELPLWVFLATGWNNKLVVKSFRFVEDAGRLVKSAPPHPTLLCLPWRPCLDRYSPYLVENAPGIKPCSLSCSFFLRFCTLTRLTVPMGIKHQTEQMCSDVCSGQKRVTDAK